MEPGILSDPDNWLSDHEREKAAVYLRRFHKWANVNPDVMRWLFREVSWLANNNRRSSMRHLFEQMRYGAGIRITSVDGDVKIPNVFAPLMARILIKSIPEAASVFVCKPSYFDLLDDSQLPTYDYVGTLHWGDSND